ncbi:DUF982 domain-containing protein [Corticibacterium sp. UT-5YL-CI-8]|nr:DUF982 domain-containing protein [Tianweitania sp. UT-5YL-CI-8]
MVFEQPIFVEDSAHIVREIACLGAALDFLEEWPEDRRDMIFDVVLRACYDVNDGKKPISVAQKAIEGFAKRKGILVDPATVMPWIASQMNSGGQATM